jgi:hypothetical protein
MQIIQRSVTMIFIISLHKGRDWFAVLIIQSNQTTMKKCMIFTAILFTAISGILCAQHQNVVIGNSFGWGLPSEPAVMMNPANTNEILVAGMPNFDYYSTNGGLSWTQETIQSPYGVNADPVILVDPAGSFYYIHLPDVINRVICHRRDNLGDGWSMESNAAYDGLHDVDKEWASYDPVNNSIYLSFTYFDEWGSSSTADSSCIFLTRSGDGGETWSTPVRISGQKGNATGGTYSTHGSYNTTGPDGEVYVTWFGPSGLMFDRSLDQGDTWLPQDINITNQHITWQYSIPGINLGVTFPFIACDRSGGPYNGTIYITWADKRNGGNNTDVFLVKSADGGLTWSSPIKVNDDPPGRHQFFPAITVDQVTGKIWVVFFDRRNYTDTNTDVYMAVSEDGGSNFTNFKVSENPFVPFGTVFFVHYIGITSHDDHVFPVWNRMDNGENSLIGAIIDPTIIGKEEHSKLPGTQMESYPNPFSENSFISFRLKESSDLTLQLFDITGRQISLLIDQLPFAKGKHVIKIDATELGLKPGVYLVKLSTDKDQITKRVLFVEK